jgi:hypothetical protein
VLAQLEALDEVEHAEIDSRGDLLALSLRDATAFPAAIAALAELGYACGPASDADVRNVAAWYDERSVSALSRVEARIIADRVVPRFARGQRLTPGEITPLHTAVADALHRCFVSHNVTGAANLGEFRSACVDAVEQTALPIVGPGPASTLAASIDADMSHDHRDVHTRPEARDS